LFVAPHYGLKKIYICRPDGKDLRRFCKVPGDQTEPSYSEKLHRVYFVRFTNRFSQIYSVDHDGRDLRVELALRANTRNPDVSPDGKTLLFSTDMWGAFELAELDLESQSIERLTFDQGINTHPRYSPDGRSILYLSRRNGASQIYLFNRQDRAMHLLVDTPFSKGAPAWNPAGTRIVATEATPPRFRSKLFELDLETKKKRFLLPKKRIITAPGYSADGTQILFIDQEQLFTFDTADTTAQLFPLKGDLDPIDAIWVSFPLP